MSSAQRTMHYARALLRAFQREPSRIGRAGGGAVRETASVKSMKGTNRPSSLRDSDLHSANSFQKVCMSRVALPFCSFSSLENCEAGGDFIPRIFAIFGFLVGIFYVEFNLHFWMWAIFHSN